jgi:hypothetical protein
MLPEPLNTIKKRPMLAMYVTGVLVLLVGFWVWWAKVSTDPQRVFWDTINQSLATSGVTIQADQSTSGASVHQTVQYSLGATNISHSLTTLNQNGTTVVDELIGTPTADYTRYLSVHTSQKNKSGQPLNFSGILGVWAKNTSSTGKGQLFSQAVLGTGLPIGGVAIPIANLAPATRTGLIQKIKDDAVYQANYASAQKKDMNGRLTYVYDVSVQPVAYAGLMQRFAQVMGLHDLDQLDPSSFKGQQALRLQLTIDVRSHHVVAASVPSAGASQTYGSYDVPVSVVAPSQTITVQALQQRLSHLQQ